jgi:amino acid adenylation domain-containing protein
MSESGSGTNDFDQQPTGAYTRRADVTTPFIPFDRSEVEQSIHQCFENRVRAHADRIAIQTKELSVTYRRLSEVSSRLAGAILSTLGEGPEPVVLLAADIELQITSMLAVLKAGKFYVPIDAAQLNSRAKQILKHCGARLVITDSEAVGVVRNLIGDAATILLADETSDGNAPSRGSVDVEPGALAYVFYTSGSTGKPKGVAQSHRNVLHNVMKSNNSMHVCTDDRLSLVHSTSVAASVSVVFGALLAGATIVPINLTSEGLGALADRLREGRVTIYHSVPSVFRYLASRLADGKTLPTLRILKLGGEPVYSSDFELYRKYLPDDCIFHVNLGATEMNVIRQLFLDKQSAVSEGIVPVGYEVPDTEILLWDDDGNNVEDNTHAEIVIRSRYLPPGYYGDREASSSAFAADNGDDGVLTYRTGDIGYFLPDGCLVCVGRKDSQVKIRGHRVELPEVEVSLLGIDGVKEAAVLAVNDIEGKTRLVGFVATESGRQLGKSQLRSRLKQSLPDYMIPSALTRLDQLPRTDAGKLDRERLRALASAEQGRGVSPVGGDSIEEKLVTLWEEILKIRPISTHDDFFELGGDSLAAAEMVAGVEEAFGKRLTPSILLERPTIEQLAQLIRSDDENPLIVPLRATGTRPPLFCVHGIGGEVLCFRELADQLNDDQPVLGVRADENADRFDIRAIARHYLTAIERESEGPYFLAGYSLGGTIAFEMARELQARGKKVALVALLDTYGPGYPKLLPFKNRMAIHLRNLLRADPSARLDYFRERIIINADRLGKAFRSLAYNLSLRLTGRPPQPMRKNVQAAHQQAVRDYAPEPYDGEVILFRASAQGETWREDPELGWSGLASTLEVREVPGNHTTLIAEPNVRVLARKLGECLDRAAAP